MNNQTHDYRRSVKLDVPVCGISCYKFQDPYFKLIYIFHNVLCPEYDYVRTRHIIHIILQDFPSWRLE
jgi:hypothetical protein